MALSGRGVALGEDSGRIGVLGTGNWKPGVGEYPTPYIYLFPRIFMCESGIVPLLFEQTKSKI